MAQLFANNAYGSLGATLSDSATSLTLATGQGARFPTPTGGDFFLLTLIAIDTNGNESNWEIVKVTGRSSDVLTIVRAQEATLAANWASGTRAELRATAGTFAGYLPAAGGTLTGDLTLSGTGRVIAADFSNNTASLRAAFQTNTTNGNTVVPAKPNGSATAAYFIAHNAADADNSAYMYMGATGSDALLRADKAGSGSYLPISMFAGAARQAQVLATSSAVNYLTLSGAVTGGYATLGVAGADSSIGMVLQSKAGGSYALQDNTGSRGLLVTPITGGVNYLQVTNAATGGGPNMVALGADANIRMNFTSKGTGDFVFWAAGSAALNVWNPANAVNYITVNGQATGSPPSLSVSGSDADINLRITAKGTGKILAASALSETRVAVAASDIAVNSGNYFTKTISGATTFTVSGVAAAGTSSSFILDLTNGGSATITWWSGVKWAGGTAPTLTASGRDVLGFFTHDAGATWTGLVLGKDVK